MEGVNKEYLQARRAKLRTLRGLDKVGDRIQGKGGMFMELEEDEWGPAPVEVVQGPCVNLETGVIGPHTEIRIRES